MDDDFNTADAIAAMFELVKLANTSCTSDSSVEFVEKMKERLENLCTILGLETKKEEELLDADIEKLIEERQAARKNKDFARSDEIRNLLLEKGILLEDTREGVRWKRS
jgi:cysteinyl-tRNA synthetase